MRPRGKIEVAGNVSREISYKIGHSQVSICRLISLKVHSNKYKSRFLLFFTFLATFLRISRNLSAVDENFKGNNVPRKISLKVGHLTVSLDLLFNLEIH